MNPQIPVLQSKNNRTRKQRQLTLSGILTKKVISSSSLIISSWVNFLKAAMVELLLDVCSTHCLHWATIYVASSYRCKYVCPWERERLDACEWLADETVASIFLPRPAAACLAVPALPHSPACCLDPSLCWWLGSNRFWCRRHQCTPQSTENQLINWKAEIMLKIHVVELKCSSRINYTLNKEWSTDNAFAVYYISIQLLLSYSDYSLNITNTDYCTFSCQRRCIFSCSW